MKNIKKMIQIMFQNNFFNKVMHFLQIVLSWINTTLTKNNFKVLNILNIFTKFYNKNCRFDHDWGTNG
jgi:hypothetical protein